jgi:transposase
VYALGLELSDPGFDFTILSDFRKRLLEGGAEQVVLDAMLALFKEQGWRKRTPAPTNGFDPCAGDPCERLIDSCVWARPCALRRVALPSELSSGFWHRAIPNGLTALATVSRSPASHAAKRSVRQSAPLIGRDGSNLLTDLYAAEAPTCLREIPAVEILRRIWIQNDVWVEGQLHWRSNEDLPPGNQFINSPSDHEARSGKKRETRWTGYKVHLSETCEEDAPHLITHVTTTAAATTDEALTETIHADLEPTDLTPRHHVLDSGSITAPLLVSRKQKSGIEVIGPGRFDVKWQANTEQGIDASQFLIDWERKPAICASRTAQYQLDPCHRQPNP